MNWNQATFPSLKRRGGCGINKSREATETPQTGWSVRRNLRPEHFRRTDHIYGFALSRSRFAPVCADKGGFAIFLDRASTPPFHGGEYTRPNIHSHLLRPALLHQVPPMLDIF